MTAHTHAHKKKRTLVGSNVTFKRTRGKSPCRDQTGAIPGSNFKKGIETEMSVKRQCVIHRTADYSLSAKAGQSTTAVSAKKKKSDRL